MNLWTIFRYLYCLCSTYGLSFVSLYQDTGSSCKLYQLMWQYSVLFGFQPIVVLGLHIQIHAHAVLGCMDHVRTDHPE